MISNVMSPKWAMDTATAARFVVSKSETPAYMEPDREEDYREEWNLPGFTFQVRWMGWQRGGCGWRTGCCGCPHPIGDGGRYMAHVEAAKGGERLGGYVGLSLGLEWRGEEQVLIYHIGTPEGKKSAKLVAAMEAAMKLDAEQPPLSLERVAEVFRERDRLLAAHRRIEELTEYNREQEREWDSRNRQSNPEKVSVFFDGQKLPLKDVAAKFGLELVKK
jgi:hypothetical protein